MCLENRRYVKSNGDYEVYCPNRPPSLDKPIISINTDATESSIKFPEINYVIQNVSINIHNNLYEVYIN